MTETTETTEEVRLTPDNLIDSVQDLRNYIGFNPDRLDIPQRDKIFSSLCDVADSLIYAAATTATEKRQSSKIELLEKRVQALLEGSDPVPVENVDRIQGFVDGDDSGDTLKAIVRDFSDVDRRIKEFADGWTEIAPTNYRDVPRGTQILGRSSTGIEALVTVSASRKPNRQGNLKASRVGRAGTLSITAWRAA